MDGLKAEKAILEELERVVADLQLSENFKRNSTPLPRKCYVAELESLKSLDGYSYSSFVEGLRKNPGLLKVRGVKHPPPFIISGHLMPNFVDEGNQDNEVLLHSTKGESKKGSPFIDGSRILIRKSKQLFRSKSCRYCVPDADKKFKRCYSVRPLKPSKNLQVINDCPTALPEDYNEVEDQQISRYQDSSKPFMALIHNRIIPFISTRSKTILQNTKRLFKRKSATDTNVPETTNSNESIDSLNKAAYFINTP